MDKTMHYHESEDMIRRKLKSNGDFKSGALCGNGSAHARKTVHTRLVNCEKCKAIIATNELYYRNQ